MLEIRPNCENCGVLLPNDSNDAMICTFECTFCINCVTTVLHDVCPNCGGGFEKRPIRPSHSLAKNPVSTKTVLHPIDEKKFGEMLKKYRDIAPDKR
jgi:hypothetical protein